MKSYPFMVIGILLGVLTIRRFGRDAVEIAVGLCLPSVLLFSFLKETMGRLIKKRSRPS
jgi:uncharacterized membrane protein YfcA